jgi:hypothetical protein
MQSFSLGLVTPRNFTITGASNATPIVITTAANTFVSGDVVTVKSVVGNTAANGTWYAAVLSPTTLQLYSDVNRQHGAIGNGAYLSGGIISAPTELSLAANDPQQGILGSEVCKILFAPAAGVSATGVLYVGIAGLNQLTLANVLRTLNPPSSTGLMDYWELDLDGTNVMNLTTYWVDAANAGSEGVVVSYARR